MRPRHTGFKAKFRVAVSVLFLFFVGAGKSLLGEGPHTSLPDGGQVSVDSLGQSPADLNNCNDNAVGSPYIPVDNWIYPEVWRLHSLGFLDRVYLNMRPWTRRVAVEMLDEVKQRLSDSDSEPRRDEAQSIYDALKHEFQTDSADICNGS